MKFCQNGCVDDILKILKQCNGGSKTRSLGQILEKPCARSVGYVFSLIQIKLDENVCLDEISDKLGHVRSKTRSQGKIKKKETTFSV